MNGLPVSGLSLSPGRSDPPVKPTSEVAHRLCLVDWPAFDLDPPTSGPCHLCGVYLVRQGCIHEHITEAWTCSLHLAIMRSYESFDNWGCARCLPLQVRAPLIVTRQCPGPKGAAEECSAERSRAPDRQPVAPAEGRAWETPADRTV